MTSFDGISLSKVTHGGNADQISCRVFRDPSDRRVELFKAINFGGDGSARARPGQSLIVPHSTDMPRDIMTDYRRTSFQMNRSQPVLSPSQAYIYNSSFDIMDTLSRFDGSRFMPSGFEITTGVSEAYITGVEQSLLQIRNSLRSLDSLYSKNVPVGAGKGTVRGVLMSDNFRSARTLYETKIKNSLSLINRDLVFGRNNGNNLTNGLGLGKSSVSIQASRNKNFLNKLHQADNRVSGSISKVKNVNNVFVALNLGMIGYDTVQSYNEGGLASGTRTLASKSAGTAASLKTGAVVAAIIFGAGTGGLGYVVLGVAAVAVSAYAAGTVAEIAVEKTIDVTNAQIEKMIWLY